MRVCRHLAALAIGCFAFGAGLAQDDARNEEWRREMIERQSVVAGQFDLLMSGVDALDFYLLDNESAKDDAKMGPPDSALRIGQWKILRHIAVTRPAEVDLVRKGLRRSIETAMSAPPCFEPRHAIVFKKGGTEIEVILCFECAQMRVSGSSDLQDALISGAALNEFYLLYRAHGLTQKNRLTEATNKEREARLAGSWCTRGERKIRDLEKVTFKTTRTYRLDGTYREEGVATFEESGHCTSRAEEGRWNVESDILVLIPSTRDILLSSKSYKDLIPLIEISEQRFVTGNTSPGENTEQIWERVPPEEPKNLNR